MADKLIGFPEFLWVWTRLQGWRPPRHHLRIAEWLEEGTTASNPAARSNLLLAFRNCGKSTVVGLFCAWALTRDRNRRLLTVSADQALAVKMARNVKRVVERHPLARGLKPRRADQWAADRFTVERPLELRDPSMLARGIGGNLTGSRADWVICDDVETPNWVSTAARRLDLRARLSELDYVLTPGGLQLYVGTPHTRDTLYRVEGEDAFLSGFRKFELPLIDARGQSAWPERFPPSRIKAIRQRSGPNKFASQMLLSPMEGDQGRLTAELLIPYDGTLEWREAAGQPIVTIDGVTMAASACCWDPAYGQPEKGDGSVLAVVFADNCGGCWIHHVEWLTTDGSEDAATAQCRQVARIAAHLRQSAVRVETNGLGRFLPGLLRKTLKECGINTAVIEAPSREPKERRILDGFDARLAARALRAHRSLWSTPFVRELRSWRVGRGGGHDDALDAVASCLRALSPRQDGAIAASAAFPPDVVLGSGMRLHQANIEFDF